MKQVRRPSVLPPPALRACLLGIAIALPSGAAGQSERLARDACTRVPACADTAGSAALPPVGDAPRPPDDPWVAPDKFRHFFASYTATSFSYASLRGAGVAHDPSLMVSVLAAGLAGVIKEVADVRAGHGASVGDLVWDAIGIAGAVLVLRSTH